MWSCPIRRWLQKKKTQREHVPDIYDTALGLAEKQQAQRHHQHIRRSLDDLREETAEAEHYGKHTVADGTANPDGQPHQG